MQWGGTNSFPKNLRRAFAPGLELDLDYRYWHVFVGMKTALVRSPTDDILDNKGGNTLENVERTFYGFLGGAGFEFSDTGPRLELDGGFFNRSCKNTMPEACVAAHDIVAVFPLDGLELHRLCLRSGAKTLAVTVIDTCGDGDCDGCCTRNRGDADALIDLEKYTAARFGVEDGEIEWADLGLGDPAFDGCN